MTDVANEPVRRPLFVAAALAVLAEANGPVKRGEVMRRVAARVRPTAWEASRINGDGDVRWQSDIAWESTAWRVIGWIDKTPDGWLLTDEGRRAVREYPTDGVKLLSESNRLYAERQPRRMSTGYYLPILEAALEFIEPGQWTSYSDLAEVAGTNPQTVGSAMNKSTHPSAFRVMQKGGTSAPSFVWADGREGTQREALEREGVEFSAAGVASETQRLRAQDLRDYLEGGGFLQPLARRAWLVRGSAVEGHDLVPTWRQQGYAALRASKLRDVEPGITRDELKQIVAADYAQVSYAAKAAKVDEFHAFLSRMQVGDVITTTSQGMLYVGVINSGAEYLRTSPTFAEMRRDVSWSEVGRDYGDLPSSLKSRLQIQYDVVDMTLQLDQLEALLATAPAASDQKVNVPPAPPQLVLLDATADLATKLHVEREWLQECIELLRDRPQLIFYGPPGTGKTFIAQALAAHLAGDNVRLVQFHPAYTYEDFFEGYRPDGSAFALKPGPLRKTVDAARENPSTPYVLIIDEINRGNLARIFGELYFLLEYRSQNVDLLYATDDDIGFTLPENVFIIGTMNTADRSIALVDAAMRRRFAFVPLHPSEAPTNGVLRRWLTVSGLDESVADLLDELNRLIEDPDFKIGPSYFMRAAVHTPGGLDRAWRTAILPLLEEHHYGDGVDVRARYGLGVLQAKVAAKARAMAETTGADELASDPA